MAERQLKLYAKPTAGNTTTTTISNINPEATGTVMKSFAQQLNALTTNAYEKSDLVETYNLDTEEPPAPQSQKTQATITVPSTANKDAEPAISYTSDYTGNIFVGCSDEDAMFAVLKTPTTRLFMSGAKAGDIVQLMIPETENYTSAIATITITS